jgi:hypothetical protein
LRVSCPDFLPLTEVKGDVRISIQDGYSAEKDGSEGFSASKRFFFLFIIVKYGNRVDQIVYIFAKIYSVVQSVAINEVYVKTQN